MKNSMISKYLSYSEVVYSQTAKRDNISNKPNEFELVNLKRIALNVFDPVRKFFDRPIGVSSGFRSYTLNRAIGGVDSSQHTIGEALDIDADIYGRLSNLEIFNFIKCNLEFDQLILEDWDEKTKKAGWVHVSLKESGNRKEILVMYRVNGKSKYKVYDPKEF